ncbi:DUF1592 domain-containing protein [Paraliomyxa miuraensis]|uniref:DUF1592 domain-containing protein n=1 Tax=Paraliomyxa miuraensis TaxID=376150 RepID=UPI00224E82A3|nr:DUF1592 domain-containing protein [Paraliomyxa miuraensis]MCX4241695.1 DUF1592 domain-containing protein [Paraliomyxa miuraensis]
MGLRGEAGWLPVGFVLVGALSLGGCYAGVEGWDPNGGGGQDGGEDAGDDGEDGGVEGQCAAPQAGPTKLRRLTRSQYEHTIRDLLGFETTAAQGFAPDERVSAFKSNAVAPVGDLQVEQYMGAAEQVASEATAELAALLPCDPAVIGEDACAEQWLRELAPLAYRRSLAEADIDRLMSVYATGKAEADFETGIKVALQGILQSPWFLYHVELGDPAADVVDGEPVPLSGHELASRLSYFLWDSMPDQALFDAAEAGELATDEGIEAQVERMLADPRAEEAVASFHLQWLGVDEIESLEKVPEVYPAFDDALAESMKEDTARFANWVLTEGDGRLETLLTGAFTFTEDPALLALYGVELPVGHVPGDPIPLPAGERAGLLTQASVMAEHAHANQTSPVHRGQLVRENLLCQPLPPPPPEVDNVPPDPDPNATTRDRFAQHREDPACAPCHMLIDPLGFGFENYDGIGAFRTMEGELPVDASGEVIGTDANDGTFDGAVQLSAMLAKTPEVQDCMARQWFRFSLGRMDTDDDACTMDRLATAFTDADHDVRSLIHEIVLSDAFRHRMAPEEQ